MGFCEAVRATSELKVGAPVAFWTEAALFSEAGLPVLVLGPGDIAQAHTTDEWVAIDELNRAYDLYRVMNNTAIPNVASG